MENVDPFTQKKNLEILSLLVLGRTVANDTTCTITKILLITDHYKARYDILIFSSDYLNRLRRWCIALRRELFKL